MTSWAMRMPALDRKWFGAEIDKNDLDLSAVVGIDGARAC